eukprot:6747939-Prymnesium_polylepis.1
MHGIRHPLALDAIHQRREVAGCHAAGFCWRRPACERRRDRAAQRGRAHLAPGVAAAPHDAPAAAVLEDGELGREEVEAQHAALARDRQRVLERQARRRARYVDGRDDRARTRRRRLQLVRRA